MDPGKTPATPKGALGTQLRLADLAAATALSLGVFLLWGGALWTVARGSQHVGRFGWSYAVVIPLVVGLHLVRARSVRDWGSILASILIVWTVKFTITVPLYHFLAPGVITRYAPREASAETSSMAAPQYVAREGIAAADLSGTVVDADGAPVAGAAVWISDVRQGRPAIPATEPLEVRIERGHLEPAAFVVRRGDSIRLVNADAERYLLEGQTDGRSVLSRAAVPSASTVVTMSEPGWTELSCTAERRCGSAWAHVAPHPYHAVTGPDGGFRLTGVPRGTWTLEARRPRDGAMLSGRGRASAGATDARVTVR